MKPFNNPIVFTIFALILVGIAVVLYQARRATIAHQSLENYYAFRGCQTLLSTSDTDATCQLPSGKVIRLVEYKSRWFLDGDLPCTSGICI